MKRFVLILLVGWHCLQAQEPRQVAAATTAMNVLYRGIENPIKIAVEGVMDSNLVVSFSNVTQAVKRGNEWFVTPGKAVETVVTISHIVNGSIQYIDKRWFRVKNIPDPKPFFGGCTGFKQISFPNLMAAAGVIAKMENFHLDVRFDILRYVVNVDTGTGVLQYASDSPHLNKEARVAFRALRNGGMVEITDIVTVGPDSFQRNLDPIILTVIPHRSSVYSEISVDNMQRVAKNLYRSAQPSKSDFDALYDIGFRHVLNLRRINRDVRTRGEKLLTIHHLPIKTRKMTETDIVEALKIIDYTHYNVLVHCTHGADRTGVVIAAYRVIYEDWKKEEAITEMRRPKYGYHEQLFPHLVTLIENLDVVGIRNELGVDI